MASTILEAELKALDMGLRCANDLNLKLATTFKESLGVAQALSQEDSEIDWINIQLIKGIKQLLSELQCLTLCNIPRSWNQVADTLVAQGQYAPELSLFHKEMERSRWLIRVVERMGFPL